MTPNYYADPAVDLEKMLHGVARLHVNLGRMDNENITTRGWSYNDLVSSLLKISSEDVDPMIRQYRLLGTLFDTLEAMTEIGNSAVDQLISLTKMETRI